MLFRSRRNIDVVEVLCLEAVGQAPGLTMTACRKRRVVLAETVSHPLGFRVTDEGQLHATRLLRGCRRGWCRDGARVEDLHDDGEVCVII